MSGDTLVFDMSSMSEGSPSVFVKKDWLSILDNQNQNYQGNQSVVDTSQLANSNKYMDYREAYFTVPMVLTLTQMPKVGQPIAEVFTPATAGTSADYAVGLKNWYGSVVHSFTLDYNGTTIIQQTPYCGMWNTFKLMTSLSYGDLITQGSTIGFYPDTAGAIGYSTIATVNGVGTHNNSNNLVSPVVTGVFNSFESTNKGLLRRQQAWNFDLEGIVGGDGVDGVLFSNLITAPNLNLAWKSYISKKQNAAVVSNGAQAPLIQSVTTQGLFQVTITAQIYLKHLHSFFERVPLLKGVFMKMTMNLNQSSVSFTSAGAGGVLTVTSVQSPLGGVSPLMIASAAAGSGSAACFVKGDYTLSLAVGNKVLNSTQNAGAGGSAGGVFGGSVILNVPAYTFNPVFETSYLSSPIKKIVYEDIYQYQIVNSITAGQTFNNLVTNGIANIKSVLVLPFYSSGKLADLTGNLGLSPIFSPFDPAGGGATSPLCLLSQFNVQVSGQNAIYNTQRYSHEQFCNQLHGANAVNAGLTDGLTSGLVGQSDFEMEYAYYYVNCGRCLPVEESVPKSVNVLGTNLSNKAIDLYIFISYSVEVSIDILSGSRV